MVKKILLIFSVIFLASFFGIKATLAVPHTCSDPALTTFSDGAISKTAVMPTGGGTIEAARMKLAQGSEICSAELKIDRAGGASAGTPYVWVPLSGNNQLVQIKTSDGTIVRAFSNGANNCATSAFGDPSRITVFPGAAVWVGNRGGGSVTRLGLKMGCAGDDCYECKGTYSDIGDGPRGVTYDKDGNIWVGAHGNDKICKYKSDGTLITCKNSGCRTYGMIGDSSGNVWVADTPNSRICRCSGDISCSAVPGTSAGIYGIGMDNEEDVWFAGHENGRVYEINHNTLNVKSCGNVGPAGGPRGVAVDGNNNVWTANSRDNNVYVIDQNCNSVASSATGYSDVIGVAIDDQNNGWIVSKGSGMVLQYQLSGSSLTKLRDISVGGGPYNYSDMTGFRTPKITVKVGGTPVPAMNYPSTLNISAALSNALLSCATTGDVCGNPACEVPITISSAFSGGTYVLSGLNVRYSEPQSRITGGLVPCGRKCDDVSTLDVDETKPCQLCHSFILLDRVVDFLLIYILFPVAVLMLVITGILYVGAVFEVLPGGFQTLSKAKSITSSVIIAMIVIFAAFILVGLLLKLIGLANWTTNIYQTWWGNGLFQINCLIN